PPPNPSRISRTSIVRRPIEAGRPAGGHGGAAGKRGAWPVPGHVVRAAGPHEALPLPPSPARGGLIPPPRLTPSAGPSVARAPWPRGYSAVRDRKRDSST